MNKRKQIIKTKKSVIEDPRFIFDNRTVNQKTLDYEEHISRYVFASQFVKDKMILDIACGMGYGSSFLTKFRPKTVIGVDVSKKAIREGKGFFDAEFLELLIGDATTNAFQDNTFDTVISFETIEHIKNYEKFLSEMKRVMKHNGTFIVSTPNREAFSGYNEFYINLFHTKEFTTSEFYILLKSHFDKVELYGEIRIGLLYNKLRDIRRSLLKKFRVDLSSIYRLAGWFLKRFVGPGQIYLLTSIEKTKPKFLIAICQNT